MLDGQLEENLLRMRTCTVSKHVQRVGLLPLGTKAVGIRSSDLQARL